MSENMPEAQNDPCLMVFQRQENILLRPRQCLALKNLLTPKSDDAFKFNESVEKVIMGGGKSKVILPLIAQKKAKGYNLVIIEVPRPLLKTNHTDLNQTSRQLFNQKAHCFEFSRNSPCSPERLEDIYNHFKQSMVNKEYWVTTGESIQSLELKYLELLLAGQPLFNPDIWQQQVKWMGKITTLIRDVGDVVIDEMHQGLLLKKELNYSLGESESVDASIRDLSVQLYRFIELIRLQHQPLSTEPLLRAEAMRIAWMASLPSLTDALLTHEQSPLRTLIDALKKQYGDSVLQQLREYMRDQHDLPMMGQLDFATQNTLAFYKEQLSALLPHTLAQKHKVHYGPSDEKRCTNVTEQVLAVPYVANSQPSERSDFGNLLTKVNYTIQSLIIDGLNDALLKDMVTEWINKAKIELDNNPELLRIENTAMAIGVNHCLDGTGFQLQSIHIKNDQQIQDLLKAVQFKSDFIFNMLEHNILEKISMEPDMLHSNALNHVDLYHSVQGLTGTPYNYTTYHQRTQFNRNTALGTDGYLLNTLQHKQIGIHAIEFTQMDIFLSNLFCMLTHPKPRAIMDVGAMFTGITNIDVATALAHHWSKQDGVIQHILYFNTDNQLCAFNVKNQQIMPLSNSHPDEINQKLGCTPEERFTYYDQAHTVGADLKQSSDSAGVVLIDPNTQIQGFLQGAMRMRGLEANQTIEIVTPQAMANQSLQDLIDWMVKNEQQQLRDDNFNAAIAKMVNTIRNDFIETIHALPEDSYVAKERYAQVFKRYFVQSQQGRLYDKYGHIRQEQNTNTLLNEHKTRLLEDWAACMSQLQPPAGNHHAQLLNTTMTRIIACALPYCQITMKSHQESFDQETETQLQKENQVLIEQNKELHKETHPQHQDPRNTYLWEKEDLLGFLKKPAMSRLLKPLNAQCGSDAGSLFSPELFVSDNHALTYFSQRKMLGSYLKPVHAILFANVGDEIKACLITNEELQRIAPFLNDPEFQAVWMGTTLHTRLAGHEPEGLRDDPRYKTLIEQIRFFNGEWSLLNQQKEPFQWVHQDCGTKIQFFQNHLAPYRATKSHDMGLLEAKLSKQLVGFRHLAAHRFQPLAIDWEKLFPDASAFDIKTLTSLAQAFDEANQNELDAPELNLDVLRQKYEIPMEAIGALKTHLKIHKGIRQLRHRFESKPDLKKLFSLNIFVLLDLMSVISGSDKIKNTISFDPSTTTIFFQQLGKISAKEWHYLIESPDFDKIYQALSPAQFSTLCLDSMDRLNDDDWTSLIRKIDEPIRLEWMKNERIDANKKAWLVDAACHSQDGRSFYPDRFKKFVCEMPMDQLNETIPLILNRNIHFDQFNQTDMLVYLATQTNDQIIQKQILLHPDSVTSFLSNLINNMEKSTDRYTSGADSPKYKKLCNLRQKILAGSYDTTSNDLLKTIQTLCEQKRHHYNILWQPQSMIEYKAWLSQYNALELYIKNDSPPSSHGLKK